MKRQAVPVPSDIADFTLVGSVEINVVSEMLKEPRTPHSVWQGKYFVTRDSIRPHKRALSSLDMSNGRRTVSCTLRTRAQRNRQCQR